MNEQIRKRYRELEFIGQRTVLSSEEKKEKDLQVIHYLRSLLENHEVTDFEDIGFCYWNISDSYAMLRDGHAEYRNHRAFYEHIKNEKPQYLYWPVCDGTQRLTLEKDGYTDFWWSLYREAVRQNVDDDHLFAEFHAHRTALYPNPHPLPSHSQENLKFVKVSFENFLLKAKNSDEYRFYEIVYLSLISHYFPVDRSELKNLCENLFEGLSQPNLLADNGFILGEWKSFITPFSKHKQSQVGINSAVNAFIDLGDLQTAAALYNEACALGLIKNHYIEKRLK